MQVRKALPTRLVSSQYNFLLLGLGNIFWVPVAIKFGKRYTLLASLILLCVSQIWGATSTSFGSLLGSRFVAGFASAAGEVS
jgi:predicted MFS family arabinose efflux permease